MIPAPHPVLRRLYALGSVPARVLAALASGQPALDALSRELGGLPLLSDAALETLVRGLDLSPLDARLDQAPASGSGQQASEAGGGEGRGIRPGAGPAREEGRVLVAHRPVSAVRPAGKAEPAPRPAPPLPRPGVLEALLDRYAAGAGGPPSGASPDRRGRIPRPDGDRERPRPRRGPGDPVGGSEGVGTSEGKSARREARGGPSGNSTRMGERLAPVAADASASLLRRAVRAGSPEAATTPVGATPSPPEIDAALAGSASEAQSAGIPSGGRAAADTGGRADQPEGPSPSGLSRVARTIARLESRRPRPARPSPEVELPPIAESEPAAFAGPAGPDRSAPIAPSAAPRGLRGLVQRLTVPDPASSAPGGPMPIPRQGVPDLLVERMEDAMLADRIAAVLRREAARQGIDLEGTD